MAFDPVERGRAIEKLVCRGVERKYYRFRPSRFYGGSAVADAVGCNLACAFCWSWRANSRPSEVGEFRSPTEVARRLVEIARSRGYRIVRVSGGEPTLCWSHLVEVLEQLHRVGKSQALFILETNGIEIGLSPSRARELARFNRLLVRVCIKGCNPESFEKLTGARGEYWWKQLEALRELLRNGVAARPAVTASFCSEGELLELCSRLRGIDYELPTHLELEYVILYPGVAKRLRERGLVPRVAVDPRSWRLVKGFGE